MRTINAIYVEEKIDESPFRFIYEDMGKKVERVKESFKCYTESKNKFMEFEYPNNIISLVGNRGSGKTSMMLTMANLKKEEGYILDIIEPELIENKITLIEVVISKLYILFKENCDKNKEAIYAKENIKLLNSDFIEIFKYIKIYFEKREDYYDKTVSENIIEISNSMKLKLKLKKLIENYIKIMNEIDGTKRDYVLLLIDDMDLNLQNTYTVIEQLRKFLIVPKLVNIVAYKENQIFRILENEFSHIEKREITEKYMKKVFPYENKVYTPKKEVIFSKMKTDLDKKIKREILKNTDIDDELLNEFLPETLREFCSLEKFLMESKLNIENYIEFLGGEYLEDVNKLNKEKKYIEKLTEIEIELKNEDLSLNDKKKMILLKEYIISKASEKTITKNIVEKIPVIEYLSWGASKEIWSKKDIFLVNKKAINQLKKVIEEDLELSQKEKNELLLFLKEIILEDKINILNMYKINKIRVFPKDITKLIEDLEKKISEALFLNIDNFFDILKNVSDRRIGIKLQKIKKILDANEQIKKYVTITFLLKNEIFNIIDFKNISEILEVLETLEKYTDYNAAIEIYNLSTKESLRDYIVVMLEDSAQKLQKIKPSRRLIALNIKKMLDLLNNYKEREEDKYDNYRGNFTDWERNSRSILTEYIYSLQRMVEEIGIDLTMMRLTENL